MNLNFCKTLTLLYIEDDTLVRQNAVEYLSTIFGEVLEAKDGLEGFTSYKANKPHMIISDIKMPHLDGLTFTAKVREEDKKTPIIITTAHTQTEYLLKAVELQLVKYLVKPITQEGLLEALTLSCALLQQDESEIVVLDEVCFYDRLNKTLFYDNQHVMLTYNEQKFFDLLVGNAKRVVTYEEIEAVIWQYEGMSMDALRSLVRGLRKKLQGEYICNVSGQGYRLQVQSIES
jgi:DNA-binding response OmpR family regulator